MKFRQESFIGVCALLFLITSHAVAATAAGTASKEEVIQALSNEPYMRTIQSTTDFVESHEIGLGAMQKVRGIWRLKNSERFTGTRVSTTWQVLNGFTSIEVMAQLLQLLDVENATTILFSCDGRACGHGSQWATRIFGQRILYGTGDAQRYRVYAFKANPENRLVVYSSARSSDRQYLHIEMLQAQQKTETDASIAP